MGYLEEKKVNYRLNLHLTYRQLTGVSASQAATPPRCAISRSGALLPQGAKAQSRSNAPHTPHRWTTTTPRSAPVHHRPTPSPSPQPLPTSAVTNAPQPCHHYPAASACSYSASPRSYHARPCSPSPSSSAARHASPLLTRSMSRGAPRCRASCAR